VNAPEWKVGQAPEPVRPLQLKEEYLENFRVLTMVNNTQKLWGSGLSPSSGILNKQNTLFRKLDLLPSTDQGREITTQLAPSTLRLVLSKGPNRVAVSFPSPEDGNRSSSRNVVFPSYLKFSTMNKDYKFNYSKSSYLRQK
jgi:hypothetical protein